MKKRTTQFYFNRGGIKIVFWKKQYRPKREDLVTEEQIDRAREYLNDVEGRMVPVCKH